MELAEIIAMTIAATSPQSCTTTLYGHLATDTYPSNGRPIGFADSLAKEPTIWFQRSARLDEGLAHRTLPLGTWVVMENPFTHEQGVFRVTDRGPYSKVDPATHKPFTDVRNARPEVPYSGCFDISYLAGVVLKHSGRQRIRYWVLGGSEVLTRALNRRYGCNPENPPKWWRWRRCEL